jgi:hypothetical protein
MLVGFLALVAMLALLVGTIVLLVKLLRRVPANELVGARSWTPTRALAGCGIRVPVGGRPSARVGRADEEDTQATDPISLATSRYGQLGERSTCSSPTNAIESRA